VDGQARLRTPPLADFVLAHIKQGVRVFADETTLPTLAPGSGKVKKAWLWAYARDDTSFGAPDRQWSPTGSKTAMPATASPGIWTLFRHPAGRWLCRLKSINPGRPAS
jgi:hypothetical protein